LELLSQSLVLIQLLFEVKAILLISLTLVSFKTNLLDSLSHGVDDLDGWAHFAPRELSLDISSELQEFLLDS